MERQDWMAVLAKAPEAGLETAWQAIGLAPRFTWLRRPECGAVMVRGRAGGAGAAFNLGEMTVTRCALRVETDAGSGLEGHAYVPGRSHRHAQLAALCDALMQDPAVSPQVEAEIIRPLADAQAAASASLAAKAEATKVEFFTMTRGEG